MLERRKMNRTRVLKGARFYLGKSSVIDCVVRDLTNCGAGIEVPNTIDLPEILELTFSSAHSLRRCRRVWRKLNKVGVEFY